MSISIQQIIDAISLILDGKTQWNERQKAEAFLSTMQNNLQGFQKFQLGKDIFQTLPSLPSLLAKEQVHHFSLSLMRKCISQSWRSLTPQQIQEIQNFALNECTLLSLLSSPSMISSNAHFLCTLARMCWPQSFPALLPKLFSNTAPEQTLLTLHFLFELSNDCLDTESSSLSLPSTKRREIINFFTENNHDCLLYLRTQLLSSLSSLSSSSSLSSPAPPSTILTRALSLLENLLSLFSPLLMLQENLWDFLWSLTSVQDFQLRSLVLSCLSKICEAIGEKREQLQWQGKGPSAPLVLEQVPRIARQSLGALTDLLALTRERFALRIQGDRKRLLPSISGLQEELQLLKIGERMAGGLSKLCGVMWEKDAEEWREVSGEIVEMTLRMCCSPYLPTANVGLTMLLAVIRQRNNVEYSGSRVEWDKGAMVFGENFLKILVAHHITYPYLFFGRKNVAQMEELLERVDQCRRLVIGDDALWERYFGRDWTRLRVNLLHAECAEEGEEGEERRGERGEDGEEREEKEGEGGMGFGKWQELMVYNAQCTCNIQEALVNVSPVLARSILNVATGIWERIKPAILSPSCDIPAFLGRETLAVGGNVRVLLLLFFKALLSRIGLPPSLLSSLKVYDPKKPIKNSHLWYQKWTQAAIEAHIQQREFILPDRETTGEMGDTEYTRGMLQSVLQGMEAFYMDLCQLDFSIFPLCEKMLGETDGESLVKHFTEVRVHSTLEGVLQQILNDAAPNLYTLPFRVGERVIERLLSLSSPVRSLPNLSFVTSTYYNNQLLTLDAVPSLVNELFHKNAPLITSSIPQLLRISGEERKGEIERYQILSFCYLYNAIRDSLQSSSALLRKLPSFVLPNNDDKVLQVARSLEQTMTTMNTYQGPTASAQVAFFAVLAKILKNGAYNSQVKDIILRLAFQIGGILVPETVRERGDLMSLLSSPLIEILEQQKSQRTLLTNAVFSSPADSLADLSTFLCVSGDESALRKDLTRALNVMTTLIQFLVNETTPSPLLTSSSTLSSPGGEGGMDALDVYLKCSFDFVLTLLVKILTLSYCGNVRLYLPLEGIDTTNRRVAQELFQRSTQPGEDWICKREELLPSESLWCVVSKDSADYGPSIRDVFSLSDSAEETQKKRRKNHGLRIALLSYLASCRRWLYSSPEYFRRLLSGIKEGKLCGTSLSLLENLPLHVADSLWNILLGPLLSTPSSWTLFTRKTASPLQSIESFPVLPILQGYSLPMLNKFYSQIENAQMDLSALATNPRGRENDITKMRWLYWNSCQASQTLVNLISKMLIPYKGFSIAKEVAGKTILLYQQHNIPFGTIPLIQPEHSNPAFSSPTASSSASTVGNENIVFSQILMNYLALSPCFSIVEKLILFSHDMDTMQGGLLFIRNLTNIFINSVTALSNETIHLYFHLIHDILHFPASPASTSSPLPPSLLSSPLLSSPLLSSPLLSSPPSSLLLLQAENPYNTYIKEEYHKDILNAALEITRLFHGVYTSRVHFKKQQSDSPTLYSIQTLQEVFDLLFHWPTTLFLFPDPQHNTLLSQALILLLSAKDISLSDVKTLLEPVIFFRGPRKTSREMEASLDSALAFANSILSGFNGSVYTPSTVSRTPALPLLNRNTHEEEQAIVALWEFFH